MKANHPPHRSAFTLVELLVVMSIIAVLATLSIMAVSRAWTYVKHQEQYQEVAQLSVGMEGFRTQFDLYPPDGCGGPETVSRFVRAAFPNRRGGQPPTQIDPSTAIVLWLGGISKDPLDPFKAFDPTEEITDRYRFCDFKPGRLVGGRYYPPGSRPEDGDHPYVYFHSPTYDRASYQHGGGPAIRPYRMPGSAAAGGQRGPGSDHRAAFAQPESFQMVGPGLDRKLGTGGTLLSESIVTGVQYISEADEDNAVNFDTRKVGNIK